MDLQEWTGNSYKKSANKGVVKLGLKSSQSSHRPRAERYVWP
jgi:hypothetical protein